MARGNLGQNNWGTVERDPVAQLLAVGADDRLLTRADHFGWTALHAASNGIDAIVAQLKPRLDRHEDGRREQCAPSGSPQWPRNDC